MQLSQIIPILQMAIGPVILISGVGLLLLTMTNRLGRAIDRSRILVDKLPNASESSKKKIFAQLQILWKRACVIRLIIILASSSALAAAMLIIILFINTLWQIETAWIIVLLFIVCMFSLIGSLILFFYDINKSLAALKLELGTEENRK